MQARFMFNLKNIYSTAILGFICSLLQAQPCSLVLQGTVRDADNSENLSFALVKVLNTGKIVQVDDKGEFKLEGLCPGNYQLLVKHTGCRDTVFPVELNRSRKILFKLPHSLSNLNDVEVYGKHEDLKPVTAQQVLLPRDLDKTRGLALAEQLKQMNGVTTLNTGATISKPMINGMQGYRVLILNNGIRQEGQQWGNEHAPEIDPFVAQKLSVIRGASAVRYGSDAIGGVVLVEAADMPDTATLNGEANLLGFTNGQGGAASFNIQGYSERIKHFSWRVQGTLKRSGDLKTPDYYLKNTGVEEKNYSATIGYHRSKFGFTGYFSQFNSRVGIFTGAHIGNLTDLEAVFKLQKPADSLAAFSYQIGRPFQNIQHNLLKLTFHLHTGLRSQAYFNYAYQSNLRQEYDKHVPRNDARAALNLPELDYRIASQTGEFVWEHNYIKAFRGKYGAQAMYQENIYYGRFFIPNYANKTIGVFGLERYVRPKFEAEAGLRYDYKHLTSYYYSGNVIQSPKLEFSRASFNLGAVYKPDTSFRLSLNVANGWRSPSVNELYSNGLHHGVGAIERGDPNLKAEGCINGIASAVYKRKRLYAEATSYVYRFSNYIYYEPASQPELTIRGAYPVFNYRQNNATIWGSDVLVQYKIYKYLSVKTRAMWVRGWNRDLQQHLIYIPADRYELFLPLTIKSKRKLKDAFVEPGVLYVARQTRVPLALDFAPPPPDYFLLGFNAGATILVGQQSFIVTFSVNNAANRVYRDYLDRFRYFSDAPGSNYTLRIRVPFTITTKKTKQP